MISRNRIGGSEAADAAEALIDFMERRCEETGKAMGVREFTGILAASYGLLYAAMVAGSGKKDTKLRNRLKELADQAILEASYVIAVWPDVHEE